MLPSPEMNCWSMSSGFSLVARFASAPENCCHVNIDSSGSMARWASSLTLPRSSSAVTNSSPNVRGSTNRRSPPVWKVTITWVWLSRGTRFVPRRNRPDIPKWTTSTLPSSRWSRMYLPFLSALMILWPTNRSRNSLGALCRRITRLVFFIRRTSTATIRRPTTSFSRSRRTTSTSGSSNLNLPRLRGGALRHQPGIGQPGRSLLRLLLRSARPRPVRLAAEEDSGGEMLGMVRALPADPVLGHPTHVLGGQLLEPGLVVAVALAPDVSLHPWPEHPLDHLPGHVQAAIQVDGAQDCLHRVGQDRGLLPASGLLLALPQEHRLADTEVPSHVGQGDHVHGRRSE